MLLLHSQITIREQKSAVIRQDIIIKNNDKKGKHRGHQGPDETIVSGRCRT